MILGQTHSARLGYRLDPGVRLFPASFVGKNREGRRHRAAERAAPLRVPARRRRMIPARPEGIRSASDEGT